MEKLEINDLDDGFVNILLPENKELKIDIFDATFKIFEIVKSHEAFKDTSNVQGAILEFFITEYGLENMSKYNVAKIIKKVMAVGQELKKNIEETVT